MEARETPLDPAEYLRSLSLDHEYSEVYGLDGAALYRVGDAHFVVLACTEHEKHNGHALLRRVIPPHWELFHRGVNSDAGFEAFHYGPAVEA